MRRFVSVLMIFLLSFGLLIHDVSAKRFGGGRSFGIQRNTSSFGNTSNFARSSMQNYAAPVKRSFANKWLGPLAGLVAGGLLATLFMQNGVGSGLLIWLGIGLAALCLVNLFRRKMQPESSSLYQREFSQGPFDRDRDANLQENYSSLMQTNQSSQKYPKDFDADTFLREAKVQFIRLQAAYDNKNLNDLREFTTPEIFAEIQLQFHERGDANNQTTVVSLDAELLDVSADPSFMQSPNQERSVASVRFTGKLRENQAEEISLNETWHFVREGNQSRWLVAGVQQQ